MKLGDAVKIVYGPRKGEFGKIELVLQLSKLILVVFKDGFSSFYGFSDVKVIKDSKPLLKSKIGD